jgi:hypothetical protein
MASSVAWREQPQETQTVAGDRRGDRRYEIRLDMRWKLVRRRKVLDSGSGRTVDFSSSGVLFEPSHPLPFGLNVELSISWPVLLHNVAPLQLVVHGRIVRSDGKRTAIRMSQHEFRTTGVPADHREVLAANIRTPAVFANLGATGGFAKVQ